MDNKSLNLRKMGSFHIGGSEIEVEGKKKEIKTLIPNGVPAEIDLNGVYQIEQMYVQYFIPYEEKGRYPLILLHGGGLSGVSYESTPDGREGWLDYFIKKGWSVFNTDGVDRGRSSWAPYPIINHEPPFFSPKYEAFERFRIGKKISQGRNNIEEILKTAHEGTQFPVEAYNNFSKQIVPRWSESFNASINAYGELLKKVNPSVIIAHSQGGQFALHLAEHFPSKLKAIILIEPTQCGVIDRVDNIKDIPILVIYGDFIKEDDRWGKIIEKTYPYFNKFKELGGSLEILNLPEMSIYGNSHMMMMDKNNIQIANIIDNWMKKNKLYK